MSPERPKSFSNGLPSERIGDQRVLLSWSVGNQYIHRKLKRMRTKHRALALSRVACGVGLLSAAPRCSGTQLLRCVTLFRSCQLQPFAEFPSAALV